MNDLRVKLLGRKKQNALNHFFGGYWLSRTFVLLSFLLLSSCSSNRPAGELSEITLLAQGQSIKNNSAMVAACKGFYISPEKLKTFFQFSALTHEEEASSNYAKLPCFSSGTAYLGNDEIKWVIRAGGVGEFTTIKDSSQTTIQQSFTKICGVKCCDKVKGVC